MVSQPSELSSIFSCICEFDNLELINLQYDLLFNAFEIFLLIHSLFFPVKEKLKEKLKIFQNTPCMFSVNNFFPKDSRWRISIIVIYIKLPFQWYRKQRCDKSRLNADSPVLVLRSWGGHSHINPKSTLILASSSS